MTTVYVAGPMRGIEKHNFPAFDAARDRLLAAGFTVISPADLDRELGITEDTPEQEVNIREVLKKDMGAICDQCDAMVLLDGWQRSLGATAEAYLAEAIGIPVVIGMQMMPIESHEAVADFTWLDWLEYNLTAIFAERKQHVESASNS
jgi:nucleoside 2-deoxyribosyltransferase